MNEDGFMSLFQENSSICDTSGNLLFYTNGIKIANADHQLMLNGNGLNPGIITTAYADNGMPTPQGAIALPLPGNSHLYMLVHGYLNIYDDPVSPLVCISNLYYSVIDMSKANGKGAVIEKNVEILADTLAYGKITAVRHGNGRDWWVVAPEHNTNCYYRMLLSPSGLSAPEKQCTGGVTHDGLGQAVFSPDGTKYARYDAYHLLLGNYFSLYDFDRCSGLLSNQQEVHILDTAYAAGLAISPNSRFAYLPSFRYVYQLDLQAPDMNESLTTVAVYDGFGAPFNTTFFLAQLAPDDKIYICSPNGVSYLHVINQPDEPGLSCEVVQHSLELPTYNLSLPNYANFRLGKWAGSSCDTIGTSDTETVFSLSDVFVYPNPASESTTLTSHQSFQNESSWSLLTSTGD
ncbi:MAG: hypothetical protein IPM82_25250 [Saprospiraceae bacterium]|nr:hypothetical protein [Saprospiraceae bacterium]